MIAGSSLGDIGRAWFEERLLLLFVDEVWSDKSTGFLWGVDGETGALGYSRGKQFQNGFLAPVFAFYLVYVLLTLFIMVQYGFSAHEKGNFQ